MPYKPCHICNKTENETLPYGTKQQPICCDCALGDKERLAIAKMYAIEAMGDDSAIAGQNKQIRFVEIPLAAIVDALNSAAETPETGNLRKCDCDNCRRFREENTRYAN